MEAEAAPSPASTFLKDQWSGTFAVYFSLQRNKEGSMLRYLKVYLLVEQHT